MKMNATEMNHQTVLFLLVVSMITMSSASISTSTNGSLQELQGETMAPEENLTADVITHVKTGWPITTARIPPSTVTPPPPFQCVNGNGYRSLTECKSACHFVSQDGGVAARGRDDTVTHKLIILDPDEYILDDEYLVAPQLSQFTTTTDFVIRNGVAEVCYPLQEKFVYCHKRCVAQEEMNVTGSHLLLLGGSEMPYGFDDFYLVNSSDGSCVGAAICETGTTFIIFPTVCLVFSTACVWLIVIVNIIFPNHGCNRVLLYHLITFAVGFVITAIKSVTTLYYSYYLPTDDCMVLTSVQEYSYLLSFFGINLNMRAIYLLMRQDLSLSILPGSNYSCRKQQLNIIFRFSLLMVSLTFGLVVFLGELMPYPGKFFPEFTRYCENYRNKHRSWFLTYYSWMFYTLCSNIVLFFAITIRFHKWNNNMNNNTNSNLRIPKKKVLCRACLHLLFLLLLIILYWSCINFIVPWNMTTSVVSGIIEMSKAIQGLFLFILYVRSITLKK